MPGIYWLASYPKSGNTWLRIFIENYVRNESQPAHINTLPPPNVAYDREIIDELLGVESADLSDSTIDQARPKIYEAAKDWADFRYVKTHERHRLNSQGTSVFSDSATAGVILLVRNPLDVVVSLSRFMRASYGTAIDWLADESYSLYPQLDYISDQLPQLVGSWSSHGQSWLNCGLRIHAARYEDLVSDPTTHFARIVRFLNLPFCTERLSTAIRHSGFKSLQQQEDVAGFRELATGAGSFFRSGTSDNWRRELTQLQVEQLTNDHYDTMQQFGYT